MSLVIAQVLTSVLLLLVIGITWLETKKWHITLLIGMVLAGVLATALPTPINLNITGFLAILFVIAFLAYARSSKP